MSDQNHLPKSLIPDGLSMTSADFSQTPSSNSISSDFDETRVKKEGLDPSKTQGRAFVSGFVTIHLSPRLQPIHLPPQTAQKVGFLRGLGPLFSGDFHSDLRKWSLKRGLMKIRRCHT